MREYFAAIDRWNAAGERVVMATVVKAWGSSPRPLGSKMFITSTGDVLGSVSGGCVEGAVIEEAKQVLEAVQEVRCFRTARAIARLPSVQWRDQFGARRR